MRRSPMSDLRECASNENFGRIKDAMRSLGGSAANRRAAESDEREGIAALVALVDSYEGALQAEFVVKTKTARRLTVALDILRAYGLDEEYEDQIGAITDE